MASQANTQKILTHVVEPMKRHWGAELDSETIEDFIDDLGRFDELTLKKAMQYIRNNNKRKPTLAHIVEACRQNKTVATNNSESSGEWLRKRYEEEELKQARANTKAKNYCELKFQEIKSKVEGWPEYKKQSLLKFIASTAVFQAEGIEKIKNRGYLIPQISGDNAEERKSWWLKMCNAAEFDIDVTIPWAWFEDRAEAA